MKGCASGPNMLMMSNLTGRAVVTSAEASAPDPPRADEAEAAKVLPLRKVRPHLPRAKMPERSALPLPRGRG